MGCDLYSVRDHMGRKRFWPAGEHPATAKLRAELERAKDLNDRMLPGLFGKPTEVERAIDYMEEQLAVFDAGDRRAKRDYIARVTPQHVAVGALRASGRTQPSP
jgi:hypothetical protein